MIFFFKLFSTWFFLGYAPFAQGTLGSLGGLILVLPFLHLNYILRGFFCLVFFFFSVWISSKAEKIFGPDAPQIVIDEVCGLFFAVFSLKLNWVNIAVAFALFRFFDIFKFPFISRIQRIPSGFGVVLDDILAGIFSCILTTIFL